MISKITEFLTNLASKIDSTTYSMDQSVSKFQMKSKIMAIESRIKLHRTEIDICNEKLISNNAFQKYIMEILPEHRDERPDILLAIMNEKGIKFSDSGNADLYLSIIPLSIALDSLSSNKAELEKAKKALSEINNCHRNNNS